MGANPYARRLGLFGFLFLVYALSPVGLSGDSRWMVPLSRSILHDGDLDLREVEPAITASGSYLVESYRGELRYFQPIATALLSTPLVAVFDLVLGTARPVGVTELLVSSVYCAAAAVVMFEIALLTLPWPRALALALTFALATPLWSLVSRALWQHAPSVLCNALVLWLILTRRRLLWVGALLALAYFIRPTNVVPGVVLGAWVWFEHRGRAWPLLAGAAAVGVFFVGLSWINNGTVLEPYLNPTRLNRTVSPGEAAAAYLVSPGRGLFVFMPYLVFGLRRWSRWEAVLVLIVALQITLVAFQHDWFGGHSYGPRYMVDVLPHLFLLLVPVVTWRAAPLVFVALLIHGRGATSLAVHDWSRSPVDVRDATERLWDWRDPSFLR